MGPSLDRVRGRVARRWARAVRLLALTFLAAPALFWGRPARAETRRDGDAWVVENAAIRVRINPAVGSIEVLEKSGGRLWRQPTHEEGGDKAGPPPQMRNGRALAPPADGVVFDSAIEAPDGKAAPVSLTISAPADSAVLAIAIDMPDHQAAIAQTCFLNFFVLDAPRGTLIVPYQSNGQIYSLDDVPAQAQGFEGARLDMPWLGVTDPDGGAGYMVVLDTPWDCIMHCDAREIGGRDLAVPRIDWLPSLGRFGYARRISCRFFASGGYVAQALAYRDIARSQGLLVTLQEKAKANPAVARLFGAVDVWEGDLAFARAARDSGVGNMLVSARLSPDDERALTALGCVTGVYDNYTDIQPLAPGKSPDSNHDLIPDHAVLLADGTRMKAFLDESHGTQYMGRCPEFWRPAAEAVIPPDLATWPFDARFIDVITARTPFECFDPKHPVTRADYVRLGGELLRYVRSLGQVVGGEMGVWWAVPGADYFEGMMSGGYRYYAWPAGQLVHPKSRDQNAGKWPDYETWGIGYANRVPLWELVFHDCVISTWYWGDSNDWLLEAAPELTARKDAMNVLYGTMPLLWAGRAENGWTLNRAAFLRTARTVSPVFGAVAGAAMLSHEFVTPDGAVQRTRFANGIEVEVNFGEAPVDATVGGGAHRLGQNGFAAAGPGFSAFRELRDGREVTTVNGRAIN